MLLDCCRAGALHAAICFLLRGSRCDVTAHLLSAARSGAGVHPSPRMDNRMLCWAHLPLFSAHPCLLSALRQQANEATPASTSPSSTGPNSPGARRTLRTKAVHSPDYKEPSRKTSLVSVGLSETSDDGSRGMDEGVREFLSVDVLTSARARAQSSPSPLNPSGYGLCRGAARVPLSLMFTAISAVVSARIPLSRFQSYCLIDVVFLCVYPQSI
jgi:hypothetical protein